MGISKGTLDKTHTNNPYEGGGTYLFLFYIFLNIYYYKKSNFFKKKKNTLAREATRQAHPRRVHPCGA